MNTAPRSVARQPHDSAETSHKTPVIQLRPGLAAAPKEPPGEPLDLAARQAEALRLSRDEQLSLREIGERLGVSKDTVSRDIKAAVRAEAKAAEQMSRDSTDTSQETPRDDDGMSQETPAAPDDEDPDRLVLQLDEPLRRALAVLRATRSTPDTTKHNVAAARAAIRAVADHLTEQSRA